MKPLIKLGWSNHTAKKRPKSQVHGSRRLQPTTIARCPISTALVACSKPKRSLLHVLALCCLLLPIIAYGNPDITNQVEAYLTAHTNGNFQKAVSLLRHDPSATLSDRTQINQSVRTQLKMIKESLGSIEPIDPIAMTNQQLAFEIGVMPENKLPGFFITLNYFVRFSKTGNGMITFIIGEVNGKMGIDRVQYWCASCKNPTT